MTTVETNSAGAVSGGKRRWPLWLWALIFTAGGIVAGIFLLLTYFSARMNAPEHRAGNLLGGIILGALATLLLGQAMRCLQLTVSRNELTGLWARIGVGVWIRCLLVVQIAAAAAAVGSAILWGFGYKVPGG